MNLSAVSTLKSWMRACTTIVACPLLPGCRTTVVPPPMPADPVAVFIVDYGRHSSLLLRDAGEPPVVEYVYGDWAWFALDRTSWYDVFPTVLWPTQGAIGMRRLHDVPTVESLEATLSCEQILEITVSEQASRDLALALRAEYVAHIDSQHYQPLYDLTFVHSDDDYWLLNNCNHHVAAWLRELGCTVKGGALTADWLVRQP